MSARVLVVDDSVAMRTVVGAALRGAGYEVVEAGDGAEALGQLGSQRIDLVISDVDMPVMDGLTLLRTLRQQPAHRCTPVLMLSSEDSPEAVRQGLSDGARAWLVKPFVPQRMLDAVQEAVQP
jgi:two-component system chemotaxis response regulator CheY